jgi:peptidoglycan hydrolase CwlO-like protein
MKNILKIGSILVLSVFVLLGPLSCQKSAVTGVTQEQYDALKAELDAAQAKIAELQSPPPAPTAGLNEQSLKDEITSLNAQIEELKNEITALNNQNGALTQEKTSLQSQYDDLNTEYEQLQATLAALTQKEPITEENVEAEIMRLLNEERVNAGVNKFLTGDILYKQAKKNSEHMATSGKVETISTTFYQEVFFAAGYDSVATIAQGALMTWKITLYRFENNVLLSYNKYGAVGAVESGGIFYITFLASPYP